MTKIASLLIIGILLGGGIPFSNAVELELEIIDNKWLTFKNPTVCVHESFDKSFGYNYDDIYEITKNAVKKWEDILVEKSGSSPEDWKIYVIKQPGLNDPKIKTGHYVNCDINILLRGAPPILNDGRYIPGSTQHFYDNSRAWHDIVIYTWEYHITESNSTNINYKAEYTDEESLEKTIIHELGHSFGLNHTFLDGQERGKKCDQTHADYSIMYVSVGCTGITSEINEIDYTAVIYKFGTDGWSGYHNADFKILKFNR